MLLIASKTKQSFKNHLSPYRKPQHRNHTNISFSISELLLKKLKSFHFLTKHSSQSVTRKLQSRISHSRSSTIPHKVCTSKRSQTGIPVIMAGDGSQSAAEAQSSASRGSPSSNRRGGGSDWRGRSRGPRSRRGGRNEPATHQASPATAAAGEAPVPSLSSNRSGRQSRRGGRVAVPRGGDVVPGTTRTFGGRLTRPEDFEASTTVPSAQGLNVEALEFYPGQSVVTRK